MILGEGGSLYLAGCHRSFHWLPSAGGLSQSLAGETEGKPLAIRTDAKRLAQEEKGAPTTPITPAGQDCRNSGDMLLQL